MAPKKSPKIVLLKEGENVNSFAQGLTSPDHLHDVCTTMATDFLPADDDIQVSEEGDYVVQNLTEAEAKAKAAQPGVEAVIDDIEVFALADDDIGILDEDEGDAEFFEADPYAQMMYEDDDLFTAEAARFAEHEPNESDAMSELLENEEQHADPFDPLDLDVTFDDAADASGVGDLLRRFGPDTARLVMCVIQCLSKQGAGSASEAEIRAALEAVGAPSDSATIQAVRTQLLWNVQMVNVRPIWARRNYGQRARVAVVDTGVGPNPLLRPRGGASFVPGVRSWRDDEGHGTHVAGTVAGYPVQIRRGRDVHRIFYSVAPLAQLYGVKVLDRRGSGRLSWILNGLSWCLRNRMHVVNLSLGSIVSSEHAPCIAAYERIGRRLQAAGAILVSSAGNSGRSPRVRFVGNPARCAAYMAVAAIDHRRRKANFSSYGRQVEISAPGVQITSLNPGGGFSRKSGTSMAAPHVSGVAALTKTRHPGWSGNRIRAWMDRTATDLGRPGRDPFFGFGLVNAGRAAR